MDERFQLPAPTQALSFNFRLNPVPFHGMSHAIENVAMGVG